MTLRDRPGFPRYAPAFVGLGVVFIVEWVLEVLCWGLRMIPAHYPEDDA